MYNVAVTGVIPWAPTKKQCFGSAKVFMRIRIQDPKNLLLDPDPDDPDPRRLTLKKNTVLTQKKFIVNLSK